MCPVNHIFTSSRVNKNTKPKMKRNSKLLPANPLDIYKNGRFCSYNTRDGSSWVCTTWPTVDIHSLCLLALGPSGALGQHSCRFVIKKEKKIVSTAEIRSLQMSHDLDMSSWDEEHTEMKNCTLHWTKELNKFGYGGEREVFMSPIWVVYSQGHYLV